MERQFFVSADALDMIEGNTGASPAVRLVNPGIMSADERASLVASIDKGEVFALRFRARAFGSGPNLNEAYLSPEQIDELAASAPGADLLVDHSNSASSAVGEVVGAMSRDMDGERVLILDHELTDPDAMRRFVRRQLRRFSVAIDAEDWKRDGARLRAVSPVRLIHNAFVSDPAYRAASVISHQVRAKMEDEQKPGAPDQEARITELEAQVSALQAKVDELAGALEASEFARFSAVLDSAVSAGKIKPAARAQFEAVRKAVGFDQAAALIDGLAVGGALPVQAVGDAPSIDAPKVEKKEFNAEDRVKAIVGDKYNPKARRV